MTDFAEITQMIISLLPVLIILIVFRWILRMSSTMDFSGTNRRRWWHSIQIAEEDEDDFEEVQYGNLTIRQKKLEVKQAQRKEKIKAFLSIPGKIVRIPVAVGETIKQRRIFKEEDAEMYCPECVATIPKDSRVCPICGSVIIELKAKWNKA